MEDEVTYLSYAIIYVKYISLGIVVFVFFGCA
jgi:hypothetical protein